MYDMRDVLRMRLYVHDAYMHAILYDDVMFMNVFSSRKINPWRMSGSQILGWCWRVELFISARDDGCENKPVGEDDYVEE